MEHAMEHSIDRSMEPGLAPGVYMLVRNMAQLDELQAATPGNMWQRAPEVRGMSTDACRKFASTCLHPQLYRQ